MEKAGEEERGEKRRKGIIQIPSYQEVFDTGGIGSSGSGGGSSNNSKPYNPPPPSSFSQAFSFVKSSEFYTPPPQNPPPPTPTPRPLAQPQPSSSSATSTSNCNSNSNNATLQSRNAILVSHRQKGNPLLKHIRNVRWMFADIACDYLLGQSSCALYLSLRYHLLHPDYLYFRIRELQKNFKLRVVLCHVDVEDVVKPLHEVTKTAMLHDCTLLCGWSLEECGRYLETIKVYENKPSDLIREQTDIDYLSRLTHALTTVRHVNKTDAVTLGSAFGSLSRIMDASMEDLARCPGIGERKLIVLRREFFTMDLSLKRLTPWLPAQKVKRLYDTFHEPFRRVSSRPAVAMPETPTMDSNIEEPPPVDGITVVEGNNPDALGAKKDPALNVKSALSAAFAKYADRVRKPEENSSPLERGEGSSRMSAKD